VDQLFATIKAMDPLFVVMIAVGAAVQLILMFSWPIFRKAGRTGLAAVVPVLNLIVMLDIAGKPKWWVFLYLLYLIPWVGVIILLIISIIVCVGLAKNFGKSEGFGIWMVFLPFVFFPALAFGSAKYMAAAPPGEAPVPASQTSQASQA